MHVNEEETTVCVLNFRRPCASAICALDNICGAHLCFENSGDAYVAPVPLIFLSQMATAIRLLGAVEAGNWSEFHRLLGRTSGDERAASFVGDDGAESPFAIRLRCMSHGMLLPVRVHALRALNKSYGKGEKVPLVRLVIIRY